MAKYTDEQLKVMAKRVNDDRAQGGDRSFVFIMQLSALTGLHPNDIQNRIDHYSNLEI